MKEQGIELLPLVTLLGAGVIAVALFRRAGLGSVLGYLAAGLLIGPYGAGLFTDTSAILHVAELGIVMFLFIIGLEMQPSRLWSLRKQIFGLGAAQVLTCGGLLTLVGVLIGMPLAASFVAAMGFTLSSTAIVAQILDERGETATARGQRVVSILLLEDLAIVPLLAVVALIAPADVHDGAHRWRDLGISAGALIGLLIAGRFLLNPMFRLLSLANAREVMAAAALLVVLGAALIMQIGGLSTALGAFLAGVFLSESTFRHQLEADIEPFRSILLGLFFLGVGMSLDVPLVLRDWPVIVAGVLILMVTKSVGIYTVARLTKAANDEAIYRAAMLAQGGEFAFVLYSAAAAAGIFDAPLHARMAAIVIISMALTPLCVAALRLLPKKPESMEGIDAAHGLKGRVLIIGFGRFGQVASQGLLARGVDIAIIDTDTEMIRAATNFGFKVYYGDGARLDVLRACGADTAEAIAVCVDNSSTADRIVTLVRAEFPLARLLVRAYDRQHSLKLLAVGVEFQIRETFESALAFSESALRTIGVPPEAAAETVAEVRRRDAERLQLELAGGLGAGKALVHSNVPKPTPFTQPTRPGAAAQRRDRRGHRLCRAELNVAIGVPWEVFMFSAVRRHPNVVHKDHVPDVVEEHGRFAFTARRLSQSTEGRQIACTWYELPPGKQAFPHHYHGGVEEALFVLEGKGAARIGAERIPIAAGDYIAYPPGPAGAHSIINTSDAPLRYLCISTVSSVDVVGYPDSNKLRLVAGRDPTLAREDQMPWMAKIVIDPPEVDYYEGEGSDEK